MITIQLITLIFTAFIMSLCKAVCDSLCLHVGTNNLPKSKWWGNPLDTSNNKYNNWMANLGWFGKFLASTVFVFIWDSYHFYFMLGFVMLCFWIGYAVDNYWFSLIFYVVFSLNFTLFFNYIFFKAPTVTPPPPPKTSSL